MNPGEFKKPESGKGNQEKIKSKAICSWCDKIIGETEGVAEGRDSHGICPECRKKFIAPLKEE